MARPNRFWNSDNTAAPVARTPGCATSITTAAGRSHAAGHQESAQCDQGELRLRRKRDARRVHTKRWQQHQRRRDAQNRDHMQLEARAHCAATVGDGAPYDGARGAA